MDRRRSLTVEQLEDLLARSDIYWRKLCCGILIFQANLFGQIKFSQRN